MHATSGARDKKIIIVSNRANTKQQDTLCDDFAPRVKPSEGIDIIMVNIPEQLYKLSDYPTDEQTPFAGYNTVGQRVTNFGGVKDYWQATQYLDCLTTDDDIYGLEFVEELNDKDYTDTIHDRMAINSICEQPSPAPTTDPTRDPTIDPTSDPTRDPTVDPTADPTIDPTAVPTSDPSAAPSFSPTTAPSHAPTTPPTG